jgi:hypothetical protein
VSNGSAGFRPCLKKAHAHEFIKQPLKKNHGRGKIVRDFTHAFRKRTKIGSERLRKVQCAVLWRGVTRWTIRQNQRKKLPHHITLGKEKKEKRERNHPHVRNRNEDAIHRVDLETIIGYTVTITGT